MKPTNSAVVSAIYSQLQQELDVKSFLVWRDRDFILSSMMRTPYWGEEPKVKVHPALVVFRRYTQDTKAEYPLLIVECWSPRVHPAKRAALSELYRENGMTEFLEIDVQRNIVLDWLPQHRLIGNDFSKPLSLTTLDVILDLTDFKTVEYKV